MKLVIAPDILTRPSNLGGPNTVIIDDKTEEIDWTWGNTIVENQYINHVIGYTIKNKQSGEIRLQV